jgi:hypothetical protein
VIGPTTGAHDTKDSVTSGEPCGNAVAERPEDDETLKAALAMPPLLLRRNATTVALVLASVVWPALG